MLPTDKAANRDSEANGALMRQSPLAIWGHILPEDRLADALWQDTALTHPNQVCQDASAAVILPLAAIIRDGLDAEAAYVHATRVGRRAWRKPDRHPRLTGRP